jgi:nucleoside phosphorylase
VREDHVLDDELPLWVPIPALAEVQLALEGAVADVTQMEGYDLKRVMRTGTVASVDNRNWELQPHADLIRRFNLSRAVRSTWRARPSPPMASGSGFHTGRCCAFPTSRCMES